MGGAALAETVQTTAGPVECWSARAEADGLVLVCSNGVSKVPWAAVVDQKYAVGKLEEALAAQPLAKPEWYDRVAPLYGIVDSNLVRRAEISGEIISIAPNDGVVLVMSRGVDYDTTVTAIAGANLGGLTDGDEVTAGGVRRGEYRYIAVNGAEKTVALYLMVPQIGMEEFCSRPESSFPEIARMRLEAEQQTVALQRAKLAERDRRAVESATAQVRAKERRRRALAERYRMR